MASPLAGRRVLVVDDERAVAALVARRLEQEGAICRSVHSGSEALQEMATGSFDLVVTDTQMPGRSGLELLDDSQRLAEPPAIILMGEGGDGAGAADALGRGADGYVTKPIDADLVAREAALAMELSELLRTAQGIGVAKATGAVLLVLGEIVSAFEKADPYRAGYSSRTARIATQLAAPLGLDPERLALAARVHDIGMLAVPVAEQHAEGKPDRASQHLIRVHPTLGARWIERLGAERAVVAAVAAHHERFDGGGYPGGLKGDEIPPLARALGTAQSIAAMSAARPWRERREAGALVEQLESGRGSQFGDVEVNAAVELLKKTPMLIA
jgi:putative nucleotidyltransferase with HDIG domain